MSAMDYQIISEQDLQGERIVGGRIRAYCHIHGSDHQRSLSIDTETGFGDCHCCGVKVLVREINPDVAARIERTQTRVVEGDVRVVDPRDIARARQHKQAQPKPVRPIEAWQQREIQLLRALYDSTQRRLHDERARAYIEGRGLWLSTASAAGLGYIPDVPLTGKYADIARWVDHIIFPVYHPEHGLQFAGRNLHLWEPGMDENEHKELLKPLEQKGIRRWRKTHAQGWFNFQAMEPARRVTFVEGAFDALALIEAGMLDTIAVIGTALSVSWLPQHLEYIALAFDGDTSGRDKSTRSCETLALQGYRSIICNPPADDELGKDWSERYRRGGIDALAPLMAIRTVDEPILAEEAPLCADCLELLDIEMEADKEENGVMYCLKHWNQRRLTSRHLAKAEV